MVVIGIVTAVVLPNFVKSIRGNRLRTAVRSVVMLGRYARSMAVLKQRDLVVTFNLDEGSIVLEEIVMKAVAEPESSPEDDEGEPTTRYRVDSRTAMLARKLDRVIIEYVEVDGLFAKSGKSSIIYSSNGRCTPYIVKVADMDGASTLIEVDALSSARTEQM